MVVMESFNFNVVVLIEAAKDYGVVIEAFDVRVGDYRVNGSATLELREQLRSLSATRLEEDPESVAQRFRDGELDVLDLVRHYGVIVDWGNGQLLPRTTATYRNLLSDRGLGAES